MVKVNEQRAGGSPARTAMHRRVLAGAFAVMLANSIPLSVLSIMTPFVTEARGFATGQFQFYYTLMGISAMFTMPLAGRAMGGLGARVLLVIGGVVAAAGLGIMSIGSALWHFYLGGIVLGLGAGLGCMFVPIVLVNNWFHARRGSAMGFVLAGTGVGGAVLSKVLPVVIGSEGTGWRAGYLLLATVMLVFTLVPAWLLVRTRPADVGLQPYGADDQLAGSGDQGRLRAEGLSTAQAMRSIWFWLFYSMIVLLGVIVAIMQSVSVHLRLIGLTESIGTFMMVLTLSLVFWKLALGALVDLIGMRWSMVVTLGLFSLACLIVPGATHRLLLGAIMFGIAAGVANSTVIPPLACAVTVGQRNFTTIWGVGATAISLGTALGTPMWGAIKDMTGDFTIAFRILPVLVVAYLAGLLLAMARGRASYLAETTISGQP